MEKITMAYDFSAEIALESGTQDAAKPAAGTEPRPLGDWELALVGGGENVPNW